MIFVDTNVFSELTKPAAEDRVVDWLYAHRRETLLSTLVAAELRRGVRTTRGPDKRALLHRWLDRLIERHEGRIIPFDIEDANRWGEMAGGMIVSGGRSGRIDSMIAAQALRRGLPVATRNVGDFEQTGVEIVNPWGT